MYSLHHQQKCLYHHLIWCRWQYGKPKCFTFVIQSSSNYGSKVQWLTCGKQYIFKIWEHAIKKCLKIHPQCCFMNYETIKTSKLMWEEVFTWLHVQQECLGDSNILLITLFNYNFHSNIVEILIDFPKANVNWCCVSSLCKCNVRFICEE